MMILHIAWRNIGRNKRRSLLTMLSIAFACLVLIFSMALQQGSYRDMIENAVHAKTGHLQVQREGYWPDMEMYKRLINPELLIRQIERFPEVEQVGPRINAAALISKGQRSFGVLIHGVDAAREPGLSTLPTVVRKGRFLEAGEVDGVVVGDKLAANLDVSLGDELVFMGQGADGSIAAGKLFLRGIFKSGIAEMDRQIVLAPIETIGEAYSFYGAVSEVAVRLENDDQRPAVAARIRQQLPEGAVLLEWPELLPGVEQGIRLDWYSALIFYGLLVAVVGFGIANTFLMAFMERSYEFGVIRAIGLKPQQLLRMLYLESMLLTLVGMVLGLAAAVPLVLWAGRKGLSFGYSEEMMAQYGLDPTMHPILNAPALLTSLGIVFAVAALAAIYPAVKAARLKPVEAMHG